MRAALAAALVLALIPAAAQAAPRLTRSATSPARCTSPGRPATPSRLFVVEKAGRVQVLVDGVRAAAPFLDIDASVDDTGERGLLSIAFAPDYATSGLFYVFYTANDGDAHRARGRSAAADPQRGAIGRDAVHDPAPGAPTTTAASSRSAPTACSTSAPATAAPGRPETTQQTTAACSARSCALDPRATSTPAIWALGLRNPWRFSFDRADRDDGDRRRRRGHQRGDRRRAGRRGGNFGWNRCEGTSPSRARAPAPIAPVLNLPHARRLLRA